MLRNSCAIERREFLSGICAVCVCERVCNISNKNQHVVKRCSAIKLGISSALPSSSPPTTVCVSGRQYSCNQMYKAQRIVAEATTRQQQQQRTRQPLQLEHRFGPAQLQDVAAAVDEARSGLFPAPDKRQHGHSNYHAQHHHQPHHYSQQHHHQQNYTKHQQYDPERARHHQQKQFTSYTQHPHAHPVVRQPLRQQQPNANAIGQYQQPQQGRRPIYKKQPPEVLAVDNSTLVSAKESAAPTEITAARETEPPPHHEPRPQPQPQLKPCLDRTAQLPIGVRDVDRHDHCTMVSAYAKDIFVYLAELELRYTLPEDFLAGQAEVSERSRGVLVDWLIQLSGRLDVTADTFHLGVRLLDHYLATDRSITKRQLQLLGATAIWLASKFEEVYCISINDLLHVCAGACNRRELMAMEVRLISVLDFCLLPPLPITFLRRLSKVACVENRLHYAAKYLLELATLSARLAWRPASQLAAAAMCVALGTEGREWSELLTFYSGYALADLLGVSAEMARACATAAASNSLLTAPDSGGSGGCGGNGSRYYRYVFQKYRSSKCFGVSACPQFRADSQYLADLIAKDSTGRVG